MKPFTLYKLSTIKASKYAANGQPNWEYTIWKFHDFYATQILQRNQFWSLWSAKNAILTIWAALNFEFMGIFDIFKYKITKKSKFNASIIAKWQFLTLWNVANLILHKIRGAEKLLDFHTVKYHWSKFPIWLPRSMKVLSL